MNIKECRFCKHCNLNNKNDIEQVHCMRYSTYVNLFDYIAIMFGREEEI